MSLSALEYLRHILDETIYLSHQTPGLSKEQFLQDETLRRAFVRSIEVRNPSINVLGFRCSMGFSREKPDFALVRQKILAFHPLSKAYGVFPASPIIGEATKQVPEEIRKKYPHIQWRAMAGMRDRLIHSYFGVDYDIVWDVVINKAPELQQDIEEILQNEES